MIDFFKNYLVQKNIGGSSTPDAFDIIKTQNGEGHINKKVVFYVFKNKEAKPFLVIYASRNKEVNGILEKSIEAMSANSDFAPKIVLKDYYNGIFFAGVEFIEADKLSLENQTDLSIAMNYLASNYKNKQNNNTKKIGDFYSDIREDFHKIEIDIELLVGKYLNDFKDIDLPILKQHGDFQDNNLFVVSGKLKIIDWDNYGMIDFPFFDFLNLYLKCKRKKQNFELVEKKWQEISEKYNVDIKVFLLFYYLYDFLRKDAVHNKFERKFYYQHLADDIENLFSINSIFWNNYTRHKGATSFPMEILKKYVQGKVLDLGCGDGTHAGVLREFFAGEIHAIDPSDQIIYKAQSKFPDINFKATSAYELPYQDNFFDVVYAIDVIEHLKTPELMLQEVKRVLKSGGVVIFQTPNYPIKRFYDFYNVVSKNWRSSFKDDATHFYKFTALRLKKMCSKYFAVIEFKTRNILLENKLKFLKNKKEKMPWVMLGQKTIIVLKNNK